jgi:hypothetical protein
MSRSRSLPRRHRRNLRTKLRLEFLEDRRLLDAKSQVLFHPEAILRPDFVQGSSVASDPVQTGGAQPDTPPNVLVNDPAEDGNNPSDYHSETTVLAAGNNTIISAFNDSTFENNNHLTGVGVSSDGGQSFVDKGVLPNTPAGDAGDPVLARDAVTGRVYLATLAFTNSSLLYVFHSDDNGNTFSQPVNAAPGVGFADKEWITVDNTGGPGQSNVYLIVRDFGGGNGIYMFRSTDQGATFGNRSLIASGGSFNVQGAWVTVGPDGTVYAFWYAASTPNSIMMRKSTDLGLTFGAPVLVANLRTNGVNGDLGMAFRTNAFPQAVVNPVTNDIYVAFSDKGTGSDRADVFFTESTDGGATWSAPMKINDDTTTNDQWNTALAVTPNGADVGVFWYDRRNDPANLLIDRFGAIGTVAGHTVTFAPNFQITDQSFPQEFGHVSGIVGNYMGDYDQAVATNNFFYLTWEDNRLPSLGHPGQAQDVRFAEIPLAVSGGAVISSSPRANVSGAVDHIRFTFDESMRPHSFDKIATAIPSFTDPNGNPIPVLSVTPVAGSNNTMFDVAFPQQTQVGTYTMVIGPKIRDRFGRWMDQDGDGFGHHGDAGDSYTATFTIEGARITSLVSNASSTNPPSNARVTFNEPVDPNTFDPTQVTSFTDPLGSPITVNSVTPVSGSNNTQFDIGFDPQTLVGNYSMTIGPNIFDSYGNPMPVAFTGTFNYFTSGLIVNGSFEMQFTGWTVGSGWIITGPGHGDANAAGSGAVGSTTPLSQVITTVAGQQYSFSFWYSRVDGMPAEIHAFFGGQDVYDEVNTPSHDYEFHRFTVTATGTSTTILFMGRNDPSYDLLDDVSVVPVHGPDAAASGGSASAALFASSALRATALVALASQQAPLTPAQPDQTGMSAPLQSGAQNNAIDQAFPLTTTDATLSLAASFQPQQSAAALDWADPWVALSSDGSLLV